MMSFATTPDGLAEIRRPDVIAGGGVRGMFYAIPLTPVHHAIRHSRLRRNGPTSLMCPF